MASSFRKRVRESHLTISSYRCAYTYINAKCAYEQCKRVAIVAHRKKGIVVNISSVILYFYFMYFAFCLSPCFLLHLFIFFSCCFSTMLMFRHRSQIPLPTPTLPMDLTLEFQPFRLITLRYGCAAGAKMNASQSGHHGNVPFILSVCWCRSLLSLLLSLVVVVSVLWFGVITAYPVIYGVFC